MAILSAEQHGSVSRIRHLLRSLRTSAYYMTRACNIRCDGCFFFTPGMDKAFDREEKNLDEWRAFIDREVERGITWPLLVGGEPALYPERLRLFVDRMPQGVNIVTNGLIPIPEDLGGKNREKPVTIIVSVWGDPATDDLLRGRRPNGTRFTGLTRKSLENYRDDKRALFHLMTSTSIVDRIEPTVRALVDEGHQITFGVYSDHARGGPAQEGRERLVGELDRMLDLFPTGVLSSAYYHRVLVFRETHFGKFGYSECPNISVDHPDNAERFADKSRPTLPLLNGWAPDLKTVYRCCKDFDCEKCTDMGAFTSWILANFRRHYPDHLAEWLGVADWYLRAWRPLGWEHAVAKPVVRGLSAPAAQQHQDGAIQ